MIHMCKQHLTAHMGLMAIERSCMPLLLLAAPQLKRHLAEVRLRLGAAAPGEHSAACRYSLARHEQCKASGRALSCL